jgi:hypothetical protein
MLQPIDDLYERDFHAWLQENARLLKQQQWSEVDWVNVIEEIEALGRAERKALRSNLIRIVQHLLKWHYQPQKRSRSWITTIVEHRQRIASDLKDSPSLKPYLEEVYSECYQNACELASTETGIAKKFFPPEPPFSLAEVLNPNFTPWNN